MKHVGDTSCNEELYLYFGKVDEKLKLLIFFFLWLILLGPLNKFYH